MKLTKQPALVVLIATALIFVSATFQVMACNNHGFGMHSMFSFKNANAFDRDYIPPPRIKMQYPYFNRTKVAEPGQISIKFQASEAFTDIQITIVASDNLSVKSDTQFQLASASGNQIIEYLAKTAGQHSVTIEVKALLNNQPYSQNQKFYVSAS